MFLYSVLVMKLESIRWPRCCWSSWLYAVFSGGCRTVRQQKLEEVNSAEGDACYVEFCQRAARLLYHRLSCRYVTWPWPLTFWPWTLNINFVVYRSCRGPTLYQIRAKSSNPRRSYCEFNIWPNDLQHVSLCRTRLWDNFHQVWTP